MGPDKKDILLQLLESYSFLTGDFTLASGKKSEYYFDFRASASDPEAIKLVGELFFDRIRNNDRRVDAIGGAIFGAAPIVTAITIESYLNNEPIPGFYVRKEPKKYGTQSYVEGSLDSEKELSVVLVEDVITTGGSILLAVEHLLESHPKCKIICILALLDRQEGGRKNIEDAGYDLWTMFTIDDLFEANKKQQK